MSEVLVLRKGRVFEEPRHSHLGLHNTAWVQNLVGGRLQGHSTTELAAPMDSGRIIGEGSMHGMLYL